jgi:hypothetical protein
LCTVCNVVGFTIDGNCLVPVRKTFYNCSYRRRNNNIIIIPAIIVCTVIIIIRIVAHKDPAVSKWQNIYKNSKRRGHNPVHIVVGPIKYAIIIPVSKSTEVDAEIGGWERVENAVPPWRMGITPVWIMATVAGPPVTMTVIAPVPAVEIVCPAIIIITPAVVVIIPAVLSYATVVVIAAIIIVPTPIIVAIDVRRIPVGVIPGNSLTRRKPVNLRGLADRLVTPVVWPAKTFTAVPASFGPRPVSLCY